MNALNAFRLPKSIWAIGIMTLLMNLSTVIIFSLSPLYLTKVLGVTALGIGVLEGVVEFISWLTRVFSGVISDALRKRKPLLVVAVGITCVARPLFALASSITGVFVSRGMDRIANGLQAPPRDALIGDSAPKSQLGSAFGLRQSLGMLGSSVGAVITYFWLLHSQGQNFQEMFWLAALFPCIAFLFIVFMVRDHTRVAQIERHEKPDAHPKKPGLKFYYIRSLGREYWRTLIVAFVFCLSTYSGAFMILRGEEVAQTSTIGPAVMIAQNIFAMLIAYPLGRLFDRFDHRKLLAFGFALVIGANFILQGASSFAIILIGAAFWGMQMGVNQSLLTATISSTTTESNRGTGFGIYYITAGTAIFISNTITGHLADAFDLQHALFFSIITAGLAILCLPLLSSRKHA